MSHITDIAQVPASQDAVTSTAAHEHSGAHGGLNPVLGPKNAMNVREFCAWWSSGSPPDLGS
jgi:hypothetical protein